MTNVYARLRVAALAFGAYAGTSAAAALADQTPAPTPSASPSIQDPCAALSSLVSRPTVSTSPCSVKPGALLIETGYTNTTTSGTGAAETVLYPQATLRVAAARNLEFDLAPSSIERVSGSPVVTGLTDTSLGAKYEIGYSSKVLYGVNVVYTTTSGSPATSDNGDGVLANLNGTLTLSPAVGLFATVGYNAQSAGSRVAPARYHGIDPSLGASISLPLGFVAAVEGFGQSSTGPGLGGRYGVDGAIEHDVGSRLQLDVNYDAYPGVTNGAHLHAVGFGAAYLIGS